MIKVLMTGSTGFVGTNLCQYLTRLGIAVVPISLRSPLPSCLSAEYAAIIHLAGKAHDTKNISHSSEYFKVNTELTERLYDLFLDSNVVKFIYVSSVKAAADSVSTILCEETIADPKTAYGKSKRQAEQYLLGRPAKDRQIYILRPCMIHGPGNKGNLNLIYQMGRRGLPYPLAAFDNRRSFVSIDNLCFAIKEFLENDFPSGVYNIADNDPLSTNEIMKMIYSENGVRNRLIHIPKSIIRVIAKMGDWLHLPLNSERLKKLTENYIVSNKKLIDTIGKDLPVGAIDGMRLTIRSFKKKI